MNLFHVAFPFYVLATVGWALSGRPILVVLNVIGAAVALGLGEAMRRAKRSAQESGQ